MENTTAPTPTASFVVVADGHTAAERTWVTARVATRELAVAECDAQNRTLRLLGRSARVHVEQLG